MSKQVRKAAILMLAMGPKVAGQVMKSMPDEMIEQITAEISVLEQIPEGERTETVKDFIEMRHKASVMGFGGEDSARNILDEALGSHRASSILNRATGYSDIKAFENLKNVEPLTVANYLQNEHPQTIALVLSYMDPRYSGPVMTLLPGILQAEISYRMASLDSPSKDALKIIEQVIGKAVEGEFSKSKRNYGGKKQVAEVFNEIDKAVWQEILDDMREIDDECATEVKNLMFVFEDIVNMEDRFIQEVLKEVDGSDLTLSLKGVPTDIKNKIFNNMSKRATTGIKEDMEYMGPVLLTDVEEAQDRIVDVIRNLEEQGTITLGGGANAQMVS
ncbi:flagellar motor switch protein FliG [bacterium]|nr:flagellar motor switch protein FliG [bacterium]MBT4292831.1 flagellar motor switch protein FliG [bacterium]MBT7310806.1 flagellar motor switch protein FliG [bacterium]